VLSLNRTDAPPPVAGRAPRSRDALAGRAPDDVGVSRAVSSEVAPQGERAVVRATPAGQHLERRDALTLAIAARTRCADPRVEQERSTLLGEVYAAGLEFANQLRDHLKHSVVEYRGSHGAWDVVAESEALFVAHDRYAAAARRAAARLRTLLPEPDEPA